MAEVTAEKQKQKQVRVVLWGTPRSLSTAMFRSMWNRKSCKCLPEPYAMAFFFSAQRVLNWYPDIFPIDGFNFCHIKTEIYEAAYEEEEVFVKDFPAYMYRQKHVDPAELIPQGYVHTFLIRSPQSCVESGYRLFQSKKVPNWTEWDSEIIGFKQLWEHYNAITKIQPNPLVIDADDLINNPEATLRLYCERTGLKFEESMLNWSDKDGLAEKMENLFPFFKPFTETVMNTQSIKPASSQHSHIELPAEIQKQVEENNVYYEKLLQFATRTTSPTSQ